MTDKAVRHKYRSKLKYIRVDFYLKDKELWDYVEYIREQGVSVAGILRNYLQVCKQKDSKYKQYIKENSKKYSEKE